MGFKNVSIHPFLPIKQELNIKTQKALFKEIQKLKRI
jgi:hypothetical protein